MKTRNLFLSTLACASLLACSKDDDSSIQEVLSGDNYVAVNIVAPAGGTRALGGVDQGTAAESAVNSAIFFFFDSNGNGCANPNYIPTFTMTGNEEGSLSEAVLVLENPSAVPSSMVAIMNPTEKIIGLTASVSLSALKNQVDAYYTTGTTNFLMSNSVYVGANNTTVSSTAISPSQICSTKDEAKNSAVTIPVERLVAKVNANLGSVSGKETYMVNGEETILSINLIGWKATNLNPKSYLIKNVEGISVETWWNDVTNLRSYWANSSATDSYKTFTYSEIAGNKAPQYCLENTTSQPTKLIVAAQVTDQAGNPVDLMEWRGEKYTSDDMKTRLAGFMKNYYTRTNTEVEGEYKYVSLSSNYITFTISASENTAETSYKVEAALTENTPQLYTFYGDVATTVTIKDANDALSSLGEIKHWNNGATYYYVDIQHRGKDSEGADIMGTYGVIRNHSYDLTINSVKGLGTPVPDENVVIVPTKPTDEETYIAAKIEVLSWRVVSQTVDLE